MGSMCVSLQFANGVHHRWISQRESLDLIERGDVRKAKRKGGQPPAVRMKAQPKPSDSRETPCAVGWKESLMLAGALEASKGRIHAIRAKVATFGPGRFEVITMVNIPEVIVPLMAHDQRSYNLQENAA